MHGIIKKTVCIILALSMMSFVFTSCNTKPSTSSGSSSNSTSTAATIPNFNATGLPIAQTKVTFDILTTRWPGMDDSFKNNTWLVNLVKDTNVDPHWVVNGTDTWADQKAIMLAGGKLPPVIFGSQTFNDSDIQSNTTYFRDLTDLIAKYMPNLTAAMTETPGMRSICTFPDGKIYSLPKNMPCRPAACSQPFINKTWLDNLGLQEPTNIDELEKVFIAFRTKDPNKDGKKDEYPISGSKDVGIDLLNPFGITDLRGYHMLVGSDGKLTYFPTADNYKAGLTWLNKLYKEDLIDPEAFTQDDNGLSGKRKNDKAPLIGFETAWTPDSDFGKWASQYTTLAPIKGPDGKAYTGGDEANGVSSIGRNEVEITNTCTCPEIVARWLDQWYTGEASIQNFWGAIGTVITKNSDDTYSLNNPPASVASADAWYWSSSLRDFGPKYASPDFQKKIKLNPASGDGFKVEIAKKAAGTITVPYPDVMFTNDEATILNNTKTLIDNDITAARADFIKNGVTDAKWAAYVAKLKGEGSDQLVKIYTDAYNRTVKK